MRNIFKYGRAYLFFLLILLLTSGCGKAEQEDYSQYVRKIWTDNYCSASLMITKAERGYIEGYLGENQANENEDDYFDIDWLEHRITFYGTLEHGRAACMYHNEMKDEYGRLDITFCGEEGLKVKMDEGLDKDYHAYNIADFIFHGEPVREEAELDSWGKVFLCWGYKDKTDILLPWILLLNEQGDILYQFAADYTGGEKNYEVLDTMIEDLDGDGRKDIRIALYEFYSYRDDYDYSCEWYFFQQEDGMFGTKTYIGGIGNEFYMESGRCDIRVRFQDPKTADER